MNREDVICNIENINSDNIMTGFDMLMVLYDLCNYWGYENIYISENEDKVSFDLTFKNKKQANEALKIIPPGINLLKYGKLFIINSCVYDNIIKLNLIESSNTSWGI